MLIKIPNLNKLEGLVTSYLPIKYRKPEANAGSQHCFDLAAQWLKSCQDSHESMCRVAPDESSLPTRIIDVGSSTDRAHVLPRLISNTKGKRGQYIALSYCWGLKPLLTLNAETKKSFEEGISLDHLPQTIHDAILVTRRLGIRYLWVDSLCIIQGESPEAVEDWLRESQKMHQVFRHATLTLMAASASDANEGLFRQRKQQDDFCQLPLLAGHNHPSNVLYLGPDPDERRFQDEKLHQRGWVYQEAFLSIRALSFGTSELFWKCRGAEYRESLTDGANLAHLKRELVVASDTPDHEPQVVDTESFREIMMDLKRITADTMETISCLPRLGLSDRLRKPKNEPLRGERTYQAAVRTGRRIKVFMQPVRESIGRVRLSDLEGGDYSDVKLVIRSVMDLCKILLARYTIDRLYALRGLERPSTVTPLPLAHDEPAEIRRNWGSIIKEYSSKDLTRASDKLPAISGLAKLGMKGSRGTYLFGLWEEQLPGCLLWVRQRPRVEKSRDTVNKEDVRGKSCSAPSWSWASAEGRVTFQSGTVPRYIHIEPFDREKGSLLVQGHLQRVSSIRLDAAASYYGGYENFRPWARFPPDMKTFLDDPDSVPEHHRWTAPGEPIQLVDVWFLYFSKSCGLILTRDVEDKLLNHRHPLVDKMSMSLVPPFWLKFRRLGLFTGWNKRRTSTTQLLLV